MVGDGKDGSLEGTSESLTLPSLSAPIQDRRAMNMEERRLLRSSEVARLFGVNPKSVIRWADLGLLKAIKTPGGQRRFLAEDVERFIEDQRAEDVQPK